MADRRKEKRPCNTYRSFFVGTNCKNTYNKSMKLLFDAGGTHLRIASATNQEIKEVLMFPTQAKLADNLLLFKNAAKQLGLEKIDIVAGGVPTFVHQKISIWKDKKFATELQKMFKTKVIIENDAALAGLAEANLGAGKNKAVVGYLTFSTGLGGSRIVGGKLDAHAFDFEPKLQMLLDGTSFERLTGGRGIKAEFGKDPEEITDAKIWKQIECAISVTINNAAVLWAAEVMIVNGPVVNNKNISLKRIQYLINQNFKGMPKVPQVKKSELEQLAGLYGALIITE